MGPRESQRQALICGVLRGSHPSGVKQFYLLFQDIVQNTGQGEGPKNERGMCLGTEGNAPSQTLASVWEDLGGTWFCG